MFPRGAQCYGRAERCPHQSGIPIRLSRPSPPTIHTARSKPSKPSSCCIGLRGDPLGSSGVVRKRSVASHWGEAVWKLATVCERIGVPAEAAAV
jgi:hypothetical protein